MIRRPLRDLLRQLPSLPVTEGGQPDYVAADPDLLVRLAESAELALQIVHGGFSAIGLQQSYTAQQIGGGEIRTSHPAAVGRLMVEHGEGPAYAQALLFECRRHTAD
ncbi:hypothetical protein DSC91_003301 [Paraburkholderia caffeinilytica]|nr:hypothetical protein DSC91_003301 [Paraburkholderia caffeinilytica]